MQASKQKNHKKYMVFTIVFLAFFLSSQSSVHFKLLHLTQIIAKINHHQWEKARCVALILGDVSEVITRYQAGFFNFITASKLTDKGLKMGLTSQNTSSPDMPKFLGWAGLVPFGLAALGTHSGIDALVSYGFLGGTAYGAVILSFLGAVHWGLAMQGDRSSYWYIWSITPALCGFASLLLLDIEMRVLALIPLFALTWSVDRQAAKHGLIPNWYMRLRSMLTAGAVISLAAMLLA